MSDGLPSDDQVRRIEQGVLGRIDARRALRNRVIGSVTAVVLVGGGLGLVAGVVRSGGAGMSSGSTAASGAAMVVVRCALEAGSDTGAAGSVRVPAATLPRSAIAACTGGAVDYQSGEGAVPMPDSAGAGGAPTSSPSSPSAASPSAASAPPTAVLCRDADGSLVVLSLSGSASATCVRAGMEPYTP